MDKVLFRNHQWKVTSRYLETVEPDLAYYEVGAIPRCVTGEDGIPWLPEAMARKSWVDFDQFMEAFEFVLSLNAEETARLVAPHWKEEVRRRVANSRRLRSEFLKSLEARGVDPSSGVESRELFGSLREAMERTSA